MLKPIFNPLPDSVHSVSVSLSVCITASLFKEHLCSVRLVTLVRIGVATYTQVQTTKY